MKVAKAPEGESRSDYDILRGLAARLRVEGEFSEGRDEMQWLSHLYAQWQGKVQGSGAMLPPFECICTGHTHEIPGCPGSRHCLRALDGSGDMHTPHLLRHIQPLLPPESRLQTSSR